MLTGWDAFIDTSAHCVSHCYMFTHRGFELATLLSAERAWFLLVFLYNPLSGKQVSCKSLPLRIHDKMPCNILSEYNGSFNKT